MDVTLIDLWLPVLVSAVLVFVVSSVMHMLLGYHKSDYGKLPDEDAVLDVLRRHGMQPGNYHFPHCSSMKELGSDEMKRKFEQGPVGFATFLPPGPINMNKSLGQWFVYSIVVGAAAGYVGSIAYGRGAEYSAIFRIVGTAAFLAYALGAVPDSIWKGVKWSTAAKFVVDGTVYALVTGGTFGWLWPAAN